ncbi:ATP-binding SpoIIE family protein phosphatase [Thalassotalea fusca]
MSKINAKLALVVDDSVMQCKVLSVLLKEEGYRVFTANDGARAVSMYIKYQPDLVLMDINMPVMNGYEATREIKALSKNSLCPLIFITSMDSDQAFIEAIEAGGDGILVRPFSPDVFKAKIKSIQRISDLYSQVKSLQLEQQKDAELAEQLMSRVIESRNYALDKIGIVKQPATLFSGDIQLTAASPDGNINVLLGDFTGHGLRSSVGAIPLSETFRAMTRKGFSLFDIVEQVNRQLHQLLPADLFLSAAFVSLSVSEKSVFVFNAGLPDVYHYDALGKIVEKLSSTHPPLGVLPELLPESHIEVRSVNDGERIILISDGIVEARNSAGEMFEYERFEIAATDGIIAGKVVDSIMASVQDFCENQPQEDDISIVDLPCSGWEQNNQNLHKTDISTNDNCVIDSSVTPSWSWQLSLAGSRLRNTNTIPLVMSQIGEIEGQAEHWKNLFTVLTELYVNALDHGVLQLSSELKDSPEGFAEYFRERELRLARLEDGFVNLSICYFAVENGGCVLVTIKDSGNGFDLEPCQTENIDKQSKELSGRGIELVKQLCDSLEYKEGGSLVEARYIWRNE